MFRFKRAKSCLKLKFKRKAFEILKLNSNYSEWKVFSYQHIIEISFEKEFLIKINVHFIPISSIPTVAVYVIDPQHKQFSIHISNVKSQYLKESSITNDK